MDFSAKYIKMCEKLPDDMKQKFHGQIDWYVYIESDSLKGIYIFQSIALVKKFDKIIPLFRQDQLQEMFQEKHILTGLKLWFNFNKFICLPWKIEYKKYSMEQLWLAFVMAKKYQKHWDGTNWIKK